MQTENRGKQILKERRQKKHFESDSMDSSSKSDITVSNPSSSEVDVTNESRNWIRHQDNTGGGNPKEFIRVKVE